MIQVSNEMLAYVNNPVRDDRQYIKVTILDEENASNNLVFNLADMQSSGMTISRRSVGNSNFDIGQSYIDEAKFTLDREVLEGIYSGSLIGRKVQLSYGVKDLMPDVTEEHIIFTGRVPQNGVIKKRMTIDIELDSILADLMKPIEEISSGTPYQWFYHIALKTGVSISQHLHDYLQEHINNQYTYYISDESTIKTYLDIAMWLSQVLGGAVTCNNSGMLDIVVYDNTKEPYIIHKGMCKTSEVSENYTYFNACSIILDNTETKVIGTAAETNVLQLADNPLLTGIQDEILRGIIIQNIFNQMATVQLRGFSYTYNGNPFIELGDRISYNGIETFVQCIEYGFRKNSKLEGYTIDARLNTTSQSIRSAAHSGGSGGGENKNTIGILKWVNPDNVPILFGSPRVIAEEYISLYANTKAFLSTTVSINLSGITQYNMLDYIEIVQYWDNVELPMVIKTSGFGTHRTISFNTVVPESEIYETHQYRLEARYMSNNNAENFGKRAGTVLAYNLETDIVGFMAEGGQPTFSGAYFCEDRVNLNTGIEEVPTTDLGIINENVVATI